MAFTYDPTDLTTSTPSGRLNVVRFLIGDTDATDPQVQDEEITFALAESSDDVYSAATYLAYSLAAKFARLVDVELDGQVSEKYSQLQAHYKNLAQTINAQKSAGGGVSLGIFAGGLPAAGKSNRRIIVDQFDITVTEYDLED